MELLKVNGRTNKKRLAISLLVPIVGGSITGWLANRNTQEKYRRLNKPSFSPPGPVFPIAWTTLYGMMGLAKYRVDEVAEQNQLQDKGVRTYEIQLGLNFIWSFLFFTYGLRGTALLEMSLLLGMITLVTYEFYKVDRAAGTLMIPYIGWVCFALVLNYSVWKLNK